MVIPPPPLSSSFILQVHNDYQRHLLYLWAFPRHETQKLEVWGTWGMFADGHVQESLAYVNGKPMDTPGGGRLMGDTTSLFLLELYEYVTLITC